MLEENLKNIFNFIKDGNNLHEKVIVVGATKMIDAETINKSIDLGLEYVAENKVNEFREKTNLLKPCHQHFIGHLQTNKVKYLIGKVELIHSVDSFVLAEEINKKSLTANTVSNILIEINIGKEESKSGFYLEDALDAYLQIKKLNGVKICGFMAMLPLLEDDMYLKKLCSQMRNLYDTIKENDKNIKYLSMGMSKDYKIAVENGSNMIRLGSSIYGKRNYF